jgi:chromosome segregation ATPase
MRFPFVLRSRHDADIAALNADRDRLRRERDNALTEQAAFQHTARLAARQFANADATNRRLNGRLLELGRRLSRLTESDPQYAASLEQRLARALRACAGYRAELAAEGRRVRRLQARVDDAVGLHYGHIEDSRKWQPGYQKPKAGAS